MRLSVPAIAHTARNRRRDSLVKLLVSYKTLACRLGRARASRCTECVSVSLSTVSRFVSQSCDVAQQLCQSLQQSYG